jgi:serine/threonine protein phosphatase PrpC
MNILAGAYSSKGSRAHNEDSFLCASFTGGGGIEDSNAEFSGSPEGPLFFIVADGMGGHAAGDAASAFVAEKMRQAAEAAAGESRAFDEASLESLIISVHAALLQEGREKGTPNMGSTLTGLLIQKNAPCAFLNAGDSRTYRLRNGILQQLSRDDSLAGIVPGAAKNIITNAIGAGLEKISVSSRFSPAVAVPGDVFFMCCDGVHGFIGDDDLELLLAEHKEPRDAAKRIVEKAIANNSDDNCTALVVRIGE